MFRKATEDILTVESLKDIGYKCFRECNGTFRYGKELDLYPTKFAKGDFFVIGNLPLREFKDNEVMFVGGSTGLSAMDCYLEDIEFDN